MAATRKASFHIAQVAHLGGIARREHLSAEERSASARRAVRARWQRLTKAQRAAAARLASQIRWMRVRQARRARAKSSQKASR